jgi:DNA (cytosine-5)-methyltransferase 1
MKIPIIDLFAGPGGLGEGFSSEIDGQRPFRIGVSVEMDSVAHKTLSLRAFIRHFKHEGSPVPPEYYQYLAGEITREEFIASNLKIWRTTRKEALCAELGNVTRPRHQRLIDWKIGKAVRNCEDWVLIGGPPCQAYSLVGRSRMKKAKENAEKKGQPLEDHRHTLYREYLRVIAMHRPAIFVMENVRGILSSKLNGEKIFPQILKDLQDPSAAAKQYGWAKVQKSKYRIVSFVTGEGPEAGKEEEFLIKTEKYGLPQARHRVILLGIRENIFKKIKKKVMPLSTSDGLGVESVIGNLPRLRSGFSKGQDSIERWNAYFKRLGRESWFGGLDEDVFAEIEKALQSLKCERLSIEPENSGCCPVNELGGWYSDKCLISVSNHSTRSHMDSDLARYLFVASYGAGEGRSPHLKDFPEDLLPNHKNAHGVDPKDQKFSDRFKVQVRDKPCSTITCHISKDGHYFIHPDPTQCRSLTVREAARIQTFPDNYFFEGGRTQQYHQVGNAVPPYLAKQLAEVVWDIFSRLQ